MQNGLSSFLLCARTSFVDIVFANQIAAFRSLTRHVWILQLDACFDATGWQAEVVEVRYGGGSRVRDDVRIKHGDSRFSRS